MYADDRVLVGVITTKRDLEFALQARWYRIPQKRMPLGVDVEYLAFFLNGRLLGKPQGAVTYYAARRGIELVRRCDLIPDMAHERAQDIYYRIALDEVLARTPPIVNKTKQVVTFIHTTGEAFEQATQIADLYHRTTPLP